MDKKKLGNFVVPFIMMTTAVLAALALDRILEKRKAKKLVAKSTS